MYPVAIRSLLVEGSNQEEWLLRKRCLSAARLALACDPDFVQHVPTRRMLQRTEGKTMLSVMFSAYSSVIDDRSTLMLLTPVDEDVSQPCKTSGA